MKIKLLKPWSLEVHEDYLDLEGCKHDSSIRYEVGTVLELYKAGDWLPTGRFWLTAGEGDDKHAYLFSKQYFEQSPENFSLL